MKSVSRTQGFTLIELLISFFILGLISYIVLASFNSYRERHTLDAGVLKVVGLIEEARALTLSAKNDTNYGVHFETTKAVLFEGGTYNADDEDNKTVILDAGLEFSLIDINGGGSNVVFDRLTGVTSNFGTTTIARIASSTDSTSIVIHKTGIIEER